MTRGKPDFFLLLIVFSLIGFGLVMVFSSSYYVALTKTNDSYYYFKRQLVWAVIAVIVLFIVMNTRFTVYRKLIAPLLLVTIALLIAVFYMPEIKGAHRWISLGGFSFQPSELAKLTAIIYAAHMFSKKQDRLHDLRRGLLPPLLVIGLFFFLIVIEPHFSSALLLFCACLSIVFCARTRIRHLLILAALSVPVLVGALFLKGYRINRIDTYADPFADSLGSGYQIVHSLYAIAPGKWFGVGLGNSIQKLLYLPEAHTDFIFSIVAEELGFVGSCYLIFLYVALITRGIFIALRAPNQFGFFLAIGFITLIGVQTFLNIGVATALLPVTGVPLPFVSYGGSALLVNAAMAGILLNISRYRVPRKREQTQSV